MRGYCPFYLGEGRCEGGTGRFICQLRDQQGWIDTVDNETGPPSGASPMFRLVSSWEGQA